LQASATNSLLNSPFGVVIFIAILWCAVCFLISAMSGWLKLARHFRMQSDPYGEIKSVGPFFYTVYMRFWGHYSSVIRLTAAADALYASMLLPFRIGHPPLQIPWNEIQIGKAKFLWRPYVLLTLGNQERIPMRISERMARNLGIFDRAS
jgi:hypothetical protein